LRPAETRMGGVGFPCGEGFVTSVVEDELESIYWEPFGEGSSRLVGTQQSIGWIPDATCSWQVSVQGNSVFLRPLGDWSQAPRKIGEHQGGAGGLEFHPEDKQVAVSDSSGEIKIWSTDYSRPFSPEPLRSLQGGLGQSLRWEPSGRRVFSTGLEGGHTRGWLWDLTAPQGAEPLILARSDVSTYDKPVFHPSQPWLAARAGDSTGFWPLDGPHPWVLRAASRRVKDLAISPNGEWLVSMSMAGEGVRAWPLRGQNEGKSLALLKDVAGGFYSTIAFHPAGEQVALGSRELGVLLIPLAGGPIREMPEEPGAGMLAFSPDGQLLATVPTWLSGGEEEAMVVKVWNLDTDEVRSLGPQPSRGTTHLAFEGERRLRWIGPRVEEMSGGERVFNLEDGSVEIVAEERNEWARVVSSDGTFKLVLEGGPEGDDLRLFWKSLEGEPSREITSHGDGADVWRVAIDPSDQWIASGDANGLVRVGPISGGEPHLLLGHQGRVNQVAFSPDGSQIASAGDDGTIRVWPMPDMSKPPLHTLPHEDLIAKLHTLTNLRIVKDPEASTGWRLDYGPFPGWAEVPTWR